MNNKKEIVVYDVWTAAHEELLDLGITLYPGIDFTFTIMAILQDHVYERLENENPV